MALESLRITRAGAAPDEKTVADWIGPRCFSRWTAIRRHIESQYPGVFSPEWLYGGKKHGWSLRYKKSKSFCTLIPEKNRLLVLIVLGGKEREKTENIMSELSPYVRELYTGAHTYHDGKWLAVDVKNDGILQDVKRLMILKRKPMPM